MLAILILIVVVSSIYYSFMFGKMKGFSEGIEFAEDAIEKEMSKRRKDKNEN